MKIHFLAGAMTPALILASIVGCDPEMPENDGPAKAEVPAGGLGPPSPAPPVMPSPTPSLPSTVKAERDAAAKKDEAKMPEKKDEPKPEPPK